MKKLYVMECDDFYKVGISSDPLRRLADLQVANPHEIRLVGTKRVLEGYERHLEMSLHALLAPFRVRGEWFSVNAQILLEKIEAAEVEVGVIVKNERLWLTHCLANPTPLRNLPPSRAGKRKLKVQKPPILVRSKCAGDILQ